MNRQPVSYNFVIENLLSLSINTVEPTQTSNFLRQYGWDEIGQYDDEAKRLRQLLSVWDAERIAILKLQYDLDKNIFKRNNMRIMNAMTDFFFYY